MDSSTSDRLTELPDSLIIEILSLLPMKDVVGTMLLSKRWLHLWTTVPRLDFKYKDEEFVSGALAHWKGSKINKLRFSFDTDSVAMADSWLLFAFEKQVEELHVCDDSETHGSCPPERLYSCSSVTKMCLSYCKLGIEEAVQWNRLKSLELERVYSLSEDAMNRILAGAPLLEELILKYYSQFIESLNIRSISLKILKLQIYKYCDTLFMQVLRVWAPNLLDLEIDGYCCGTCLLDVPSLTTAEIGFYRSRYPVQIFDQVFRSIRHVEKLTLSRFTIKILFRLKHIFVFPKVKFLSFDVGRAKEMLGVLHMFPNLTTLRVQHDWDMVFNSKVIGSHLSKADLASPVVRSLKRVEIDWFMRDISIIPALEILLENAKLLDTMEFKAFWNRWRGDKPELLSKSASSPTAMITLIHFI